ncbi:MAG: site-specific integrase, partial [Herbaspirillum sp.]|uniref:site-specific integrase n=1 Tax=Herbaspirillum sp. TaxID=1890675 RepID=UPI002582B34E
MLLQLKRKPDNYEVAAGEVQGWVGKSQCRNPDLRCFMDMDREIKKYMTLLKARGYAEETIERYTLTLEVFKRYAHSVGIEDLKKVNEELVLDYQEKIMSKRLVMESKLNYL